MPYRVFLINNLIGGVIWGVGYSLLGYLAGSAYVAVERKVGAGVAIAAVVVVITVAAVLGWRRHRAAWHRRVEPADEFDPPEPAEG